MTGTTKGVSFMGLARANCRRRAVVAALADVTGGRVTGVVYDRVACLRSTRMESLCDLIASSDMADRASSKLGAALKARRRAKRLTLRVLSAEIGVSFNTLSRVGNVGRSLI